jgi:hypothetical protein
MAGTRTGISIILVSLLVLGGGAGLPPTAEAASEIEVKNETGYNLDEVKYVQLAGESKKLVGRSQLAHGKSCTFNLSRSGDYIVYISFMKDGEKIYAKGNRYFIEDGVTGTLTLQKVVFSDKGSSVRFINKAEFDSIK